MTFFHLFLVAVVQGLTEFLPVSSSGHLILLPHLTGHQDQGVVIDVAVHVGTLFAVILYFWSDVRLALSGLPRLATGRADTPGARLAMLLLIASVPVIAFGLVLKLTGLYEELRSIKIIGWAMLIFGVLLYWSDQNGETTKDAKDWTISDAMTMGVWQAIALIPGTSRSGITITGARFLGYNRHDAAKLAMLMSIPTIMASGFFLGTKAMISADYDLLRDCAIAAVLAFFAALFALVLMMHLLKSVSYTPYVLYRIALGGVLLFIAYS